MIVFPRTVKSFYGSRRLNNSKIRKYLVIHLLVTCQMVFGTLYERIHIYPRPATDFPHLPLIKLLIYISIIPVYLSTNTPINNLKTYEL